MKVSFQGEKGSYSESAVLSYFDKVEPVPLRQFAGVFASVGGIGLLPGIFGGGENAAAGLHQFYVQAVSVVATMVYAGVVSFILFKILDATMGLRVGDREEFEGLDLSQHGEAGYTD